MRELLTDFRQFSKNIINVSSNITKFLVNNMDPNMGEANAQSFFISLEFTPHKAKQPLQTATIMDRVTRNRKT